MKSLIRSFVNLFLLLISLFISTASFATLPPTLEAVVKRYKIPLNEVSIIVQEVSDSKALLAFNPSQPRNPASTIKLLTTWAALEHLGPTWTWPTEVYLEGELRNGILKGDLLLKGYGDPYFITERLWNLQRELKKRGLQNINGNLIIDNSYFSNEYIDPNAFDNRGLRAYNANPSALLVNFQAIRLEFLPNKLLNSVKVFIDPKPSNLLVEKRLKLKKGLCGGYQNGVNVALSDAKSRNKIILSGRYGSECDLYSLNRSVLSAPEFAFGVFHSLWEESGGRIKGNWELGTVLEGKDYFLRVESPPLSYIITYINKFSNNVMAKNLFLTLGAEMEGNPGSFEKARSALKNILDKKGLRFPELFLDNGSGLSRQTRIAASSISKLLIAATQSPWEAEFVSSLSLSGLDGTLTKRFEDDILTGRMHLKTGRLSDVSSLAGYVHSRSGKDFAVVLLQNYSNADQVGEVLQAELMRWVYEQ
ncbi:MAG: D-alanyl-D-alanine carboxypeptidase/D-alanyl-D-alanine-endopeptidase [Pseudomonadota bacterium]|nr:D-alanyl-D-alanine carboxypeptidase/D-alanyl-D-alanine-endopeptidase [Pseudomonadota bacterium]